MQELELSASQARELTDRIRVGVEAIWELVKEAYRSRAWSALGYESWDDYCTREFGTSRIKLPREERQEVVSSMREIGMSTRAIASATGISQPTVSRQLSSSDSFESVEVTGVNGKTYTPKPRPEPATPEWEDVGTIPQSRLKDIARPTATTIPQSELDELNAEEEVRPVFQAPGEPDPEQEPTPRRGPVEIDRELEAQARAKSSAPDGGHDTDNPASRNAKRFEALILARNILKDSRTLAGMLADTGGIQGMQEHLEDIATAIEAAVEANNGSGFDTELNNLLK